MLRPPGPTDSAGGLIVVSNRLPYDIPREDASRPPRRNVGGLVNALEPVLTLRGGAWIGWDGATRPSAAEIRDRLVRPRIHRTDTGVELVGVPLSERDIARYYHGFSNRALWPLFHDFPGKSVFAPEDWAAYERINRRFAEVAYARAEGRDRIWVQDYHLMLVPRLLRDLGFRGRIDFFLHIPFPPAEIFRVLPSRDRVLRGLLGADSVAFHVGRYRDNFAEAVAIRTGRRPIGPDAGGRLHLRHDRGVTTVGAVPIGIDVDAYASRAAAPEVEAKARRIRAAFGGRTILFAADRLDYTKGIRERLLAFERFLRLHPKTAGKCVFVNVVVPSRHQVDEYRALKREIDRQVGRINGEHAFDGWMPIHYRYRALDRDDLIAHYLAASVAVVAPLRDGMNLVAAEFVASRIDMRGVLVLSEFAGVSERLPGALLVNPSDLDGFAVALRRALSMDDAEVVDRMHRMRPLVESNPSSIWAKEVLSLGEPGRGGDRSGAASTGKILRNADRAT